MIWQALVWLVLASHCAVVYTWDDCQDEHNKRQGLQFTAECDTKDNKKYAPVQCIGEWCFCIGKYGRIIDGYSAHITEKNLMGNCECARTSKNKYPHDCDSRGNHLPSCLKQLKQIYTNLGGSLLTCGKYGHYAPVQCNTNGQCYCARKSTGKKIEKYNEGPKEKRDCLCAREEEEKKTTLHCLTNGDFPAGSSRQCAAVNTAQIPISKKDATSTTAVPTLSTRPTQCQLLMRMFNSKQTKQEPFCEKDGTFKEIQCFSDDCYCADKLTGKRLGAYAFRKDSDDYKKANCQCARDEAVYALTSEKLNVNCRMNGNYQTCGQAYWHDTRSFTKRSERPKCDCKGFFKAKQCEGDICRCANKHGHIIGSYLIPLALAPQKTCACALEEDSFRAMGTPGKMQYACDSYGDYEKA